MKNIKYFFIMVFSVMLFVSCSKDDSSSAPGINDLVGTWETTNTQEGIEYIITVTFNSNKSGTTVMVSTFQGNTKTETDNFTWSTNGNKLTIISSGDSDVSTYSISGNKLTVTSDTGVVFVFTKK